MTENYDQKFKTQVELPAGFEIYTSLEILKAKDVSYKGFVITNVTKSRNIISSFGAGLKSIVGGNIKGFTYLTNNTRNEVINELIQITLSKNANAIIGLRCEVTEISQGILDFVAYGTAVSFTR